MQDIVMDGTLTTAETACSLYLVSCALN